MILFHFHPIQLLYHSLPKVTYKNGELFWVTDRHLSWVPFMRFAREDREQNIELFWYEGSFFFRTTRGIVKGEELVVWPSKRMSMRIGISEVELQETANNGEQNIYLFRFYFFSSFPHFI